MEFHRIESDYSDKELLRTLQKEDKEKQKFQKERLERMFLI